MLKIVVFHICEHFCIHEVEAKNDMEAATQECKLEKMKCPNCQEEE